MLYSFLFLIRWSQNWRGLTKEERADKKLEVSKRYFMHNLIFIGIPSRQHLSPFSASFNVDFRKSQAVLGLLCLAPTPPGSHKAVTHFSHSSTNLIQMPIIIIKSRWGPHPTTIFIPPSLDGAVIHAESRLMVCFTWLLFIRKHVYAFKQATMGQTALSPLRGT